MVLLVYSQVCFNSIAGKNKEYIVERRIDSMIAE
jgi:hypothetical protein